MSADIESFLAASRRAQRVKGPRCAGGQLSDAAQALVTAALAAGITQPAIAATLRSEDGTGEVISATQIRYHFVLRRCSCWAEA